MENKAKINVKHFLWSKIETKNPNGWNKTRGKKTITFDEQIIKQPIIEQPKIEEPTIEEQLPETFEVDVNFYLN